MQSKILWNGTVSVRLSHSPSIAACGRFAAVVQADRRYRSVVGAVAVGNATLSAYIGSWTQIYYDNYLLSHFTAKNTCLFIDILTSIKTIRLTITTFFSLYFVQCTVSVLSVFLPLLSLWCLDILWLDLIIIVSVM